MPERISVVQGRHPAETRRNNVRYAISEGRCPYCHIPIEIVSGGLQCRCGFMVTESEFNSLDCPPIPVPLRTRAENP